ncbi:hypothetical protein SLEP1_g17118 [Rubroshorea leprosula]|uniref:Uncharacterized protein n=1 Tax=Rubroshorea leprosula TaxID=152421 RepID=A0AAV5J2G4_9ROSI|nr:hypothetical protein SLEP1_g17118 [Rubroshorea leprosula]
MEGLFKQRIQLCLRIQLIPEEDLHQLSPPQLLD